MEQELIWADRPEPFDPFEADEDLLAAILSGVLKPEAAPEFLSTL